jgi:hypothetical protein
MEDYAALALPLAIAVMAAFVTIYPIHSSRWRHFWAAVFVAVGLITCFVIWDAVTSSHKFQDIMTGGENYSYITALPMDNNPFSEPAVFVVNSGSTPLYEVIGTFQKEREGGPMTLINKFYFPIMYPPNIRMGSFIGEGKYVAFISERNGQIFETLEVIKDAAGLHRNLTVYFGELGPGHILSPVLQDPPQQERPEARAPLPPPVPRN